MTSKYGTKTLTEILNLDSVGNSYRQHEGIGIILQVELLKESTCPRCGKKVIDCTKIIDIW